jgi:hypothetical protein
MAHYSRRLFVHHIAELEPGDLIDISATADPYWSVVDRIGDCEEDEYADESCEGDCRGVIFHVDEGDVAAWHVTREEGGVYAGSRPRSTRPSSTPRTRRTPPRSRPATLSSLPR